MSKGKLEKFEEVTAFENTLELTDFQKDHSLKPKGRWNKDIFQNDNPIVFELACGKGTYTLELARRNPHKNFIGVDIKGDRIWKGAKQALEEDLGNVRFLRIYIDHLDEYFAYGEVDEAWITFPDPYPRRPDRSKRLTSSKFLNIYQKVFVPGAQIHLKTDSNNLFEFSKTSVSQFGCNIQEVVSDIYTQRPDSELLTIQTHYEKRWLEVGKAIKYLRFSLSE
jgi:tRNA (guanine-N7-)-methyltransferase